MAEPLCILIADDKMRARKSLRALLSAAHPDLDIRGADNGREALQMVDELQTELVVMDVRMPEVDGLQAPASIKARWPKVKVVVLSMYAEYQTEALASGADAFAGKGGSPERLLDMLSAAIQKGA